MINPKDQETIDISNMHYGDDYINVLGNSVK